VIHCTERLAACDLFTVVYCVVACNVGVAFCTCVLALRR